jgi:hypothetical protein
VDGDVVALCVCRSKPSGEIPVEFDGGEVSDGPGESVGERAESGAYLEHMIVGTGTRGVDDPALRVRVDEEVLAE